MQQDSLVPKEGSMNCYVCAQAGEQRAAVGICRHCYVALCMDHLRESQDHRQGGLNWTCRHLLCAGHRVGAGVR